MNAMCPPGVDQTSMKDVRCPPMPKESVGMCPSVPESELCLPVPGLDQSSMKDVRCPPKESVGICPPVPERELCLPVPNVKTRLDSLELQRQSRARDEIRGGRLWTWNVIEEIILDNIKSDGLNTALGRTGPTSHLQAITCLGVEGPPVKMSTNVYISK